MPTDDPMRDFVRQVFRDPDAEEQPASEEEAPATNHVPREGDNPRPVDPNQDMREFTRALFHNDH